MLHVTYLSTFQIYHNLVRSWLGRRYRAGSTRRTTAARRGHALPSGSLAGVQGASHGRSVVADEATTYRILSVGWIKCAGCGLGFAKTYMHKSVRVCTPPCWGVEQWWMRILAPHALKYARKIYAFVVNIPIYACAFPAAHSRQQQRLHTRKHACRTTCTWCSRATRKL